MKNIKKYLLIITIILGLICPATAQAPKKTKPLKNAKNSSKKIIPKKLGSTAEAISKSLSPEAKVIISTKEATAGKKPIQFKDLSKKDPAYSYIIKIVGSYEAMSGFKDGTFRSKKLATKTELIETIKLSLKYVENKYLLPISFEVKSDKSVKPVSRAISAQALAKALNALLVKYEITPEVISSKRIFTDLKAKAPARKDIDLILSYGIISPSKTFNGKKSLDRATLAIMSTKFIEKCVEIIDKLPKDKLDKLYKKNKIEPKKEHVTAPSVQIEKQLVVGKPKAYLSGLYGNVFESASSTSNWMGFGGAASFGNTFNTLGLKGDFELTGKYSFNQIIYLVPGSGGVVSGGTIYENRIDVDLNTLYPVVNFYGYKGLFLLGGKYSNIINQLSPASFLALNAGVATVVPLFGTNMLGRVFYSILPAPPKTTSSLGAPSSLLNYEAGIDFELFKTPMIAGYSGETMFINGSAFTRFYNLFFLRYFL